MIKTITVKYITSLVNRAAGYRLPRLCDMPANPFAIFLVHLAEQHEKVRGSRTSRVRFRRAIATRRHRARVLAPFAPLTVRNRERKGLVAFLIPILCDSQRSENVALHGSEGTSMPNRQCQAGMSERTHNLHLLVIEMLRGSRTDPVVQPPLGVPVYPEQHHVAQGSDVCAVSRKFVPERGVLHKVILEKRNDFVVHALGALQGGGRW
ncbi:hypothetical protein BJV78DRAFT_441843 [Lactifluus subvellereus]|nr:hypothetical protein BJV78DRAFT_441843 [Lactifluus subvellereus]